MKKAALRILVVSFSVAGIGLLSLSPSEAANMPTGSSLGGVGVSTSAADGSNDGNPNSDSKDVGGKNESEEGGPGSAGVSGPGGCCGR